MTKRTNGKASPNYAVRQSKMEASFDEVLTDLLEIIVTVITVVRVEKLNTRTATEKTQGKCDSFQAGLPFAKVPYSDSDDQ